MVIHALIAMMNESWFYGNDCWITVCYQIGYHYGELSYLDIMVNSHT